MRIVSGGLAALTLSATTALAGGLDRTGQPITMIFEDGNYAEFSFGRASPDLTGNDVAGLNPFQTPTGNVGLGFNQVAGGLKYQINDQWSFALLYDQPWGSDVSYPDANRDPNTPGSILLGGTEAIANSDAVTGILRYRFDDNWSVHGGLRAQQVDGDITLSGLAYGPYSGYNINVDRDLAFGWLAGFAYEIPDIAARIALTYQSEVEHDFDTTETFAFLPGEIDGSQKVKTPQSVNLDFQTGVAPDTLLFGGIRWVEHSVTQLETTAVGPLPSVELIDISDSITYNLGVAHRFNETWAASLAFGYEHEDSDDLVSPLAPTNGFKSISLGLQYTVDKIKISGGIRYTKLGDAFAETGTPDVARASFKDNDVVSYGIRIGFYF